MSDTVCPLAESTQSDIIILHKKKENGAEWNKQMKADYLIDLAFTRKKLPHTNTRVDLVKMKIEIILHINWYEKKVKNLFNFKKDDNLV